MQILVTGSAGLIGRALVEVLEDVGHAVVGYDLQAGRDILDVGQLADCMVGCEVVAHLAGISYPRPGFSWAEYWRANVQGTQNVARVAEQVGVRRLVYTSSTSFYGAERGFDPRWPVDEMALPYIRYAQARPMDANEQAALFYSTSKVVNEMALAAYGLRQVLQVVILRLCPTSAAGAPYAWGLRLTLDRAARALRRALEDPRPVWYEVYNVAEDDVEPASTEKWRRWAGWTREVEDGQD